MIDKLRASVADALADVPRRGAVIAVGGFGDCGAPLGLVEALCDLDVRDVHVVSNNCGIGERGLARLLIEERIARFTGSFPAHARFGEQYRSGRIHLDLVPQGTLAERLRAAGAGLPAFYTPASAGTDLGEGAFPAAYGPDGEVAEYCARKETREFDGRTYVLEHALHPDVALVRAHRADRMGNLVFRLTARNFNPLCAMAARITIAEVENVVPIGALPPDEVHLPGIFVDHMVEALSEIGLPE
ncbi:succinyl-CoA--3-ketoacid-CoA transferase [Acrocarpospora pleiomorpha]|uniref:Succinyl-CoA--3-ketoacid-CoA transferase n=1 Tax=Acrocarpospora pleiomorpha TaxID=90975 RepID=A0A5M3XD03_9ACTN|nr:3-oxoacid CoA-transferase subunit A [Acrocarpospora pleiomorpha]GES19094.1 succinyl-CoA--3-ketoacid-CoA transferase [Acrocarpospora pleiomorpha]